MSPDETTGWMTTGQVAEFLEVSETRVLRLADAGRLRFQRTKLGRLFDPDGVQRYAETRRVLHRNDERPEASPGEELSRRSPRR